MDVINVPLSKVRSERDPRGDADVSDLIESMAEIGQLHPVLVRKNGRYYALLAGNRRTRAARALKWKTIAAVVATTDRLHTELAAIDENLVRQDLPVKVQAREIAARKRIYEQLHPETKHGATGKYRSKGKISQSGANRQSKRFAESTAEAMGVGETKVKELAVLGAKATDEVLDAIDNKDISKREASKLAKLPPSKQRSAINKRKKQKQAEKENNDVIALVEKKLERVCKCATSLHGATQRLEALLRSNKAEIKSIDMAFAKANTIMAKGDIEKCIEMMEA